jgi:nitrogen fixation/metabolism regulation signal transduction histidine kinase
MEKIAAGDLNACVKVETGGEFAVLERGVNHMVAELKNFLRHDAGKDPRRDRQAVNGRRIMMRSRVC